MWSYNAERFTDVGWGWVASDRVKWSSDFQESPTRNVGKSGEGPVLEQLVRIEWNWLGHAHIHTET